MGYYFVFDICDVSGVVLPVVDVGAALLLLLLLLLLALVSVIGTSVSIVIEFGLTRISTLLPSLFLALTRKELGTISTSV